MRWEDDVVAAAAARTGAQLPAVVTAFAVLLEASWPRSDVQQMLREAMRDGDPVSTCRSLLACLDLIHRFHPTSMFWWKNESSQFLGFCPRFAIAAGLPPLTLLGVTDGHPEIAWNRQAARYLRDDREVLATLRPRFNILERQDRGDSTVWLRTSKVPFRSADGSGTVGGFDTISVEEAQRIARTGA